MNLNEGQVTKVLVYPHGLDKENLGIVFRGIRLNWVMKGFCGDVGDSGTCEVMRRKRGRKTGSKFILF